jgi:Holliday junction DNA helicase RuvA
VIGRLRGIILEKQPPLVLLETGGVGYEVHLPMTCFYELPDVGKEAIIFTHFIVVKMRSCCMALTTSRSARCLKS